jgi:hypothetical protein
MPFFGIFSVSSLKKVKGGRKEGLAGTSSLTDRKVVPASSPTLPDCHKGPLMAAQGIKEKKGIFGSFVTTEVTTSEQDDVPPKVLPDRPSGTPTSKIRLTFSNKDKVGKKRTNEATGYALRAAVPKTV